MDVLVNLIVDVIQKVGFPIFVSIWLLLRDRDEKTQMRSAIQDLTVAVQKMTVIVQGIVGEPDAEGNR